MNTNIPDPGSSDERYQAGTTPVQALTSPAIPVLPGMVLSPRLGRPIRNRVEPKQDSPEADAARPTEA